MNCNKFYIICSDELIKQANRIPAVIGRASMVHNLIGTYKLFQHYKVVKPNVASYNELKEFHSELYLKHLKTLVDVDKDYITTSQDEEYGLGYDCTPVSQMFELASSIAGASITAAKCLVLGMADIVINWCGGWHHASRNSAEGFCYVNDVVLAIEHLRRKFSKVLYIDFDIHHGNGVQDAYIQSNSVFTLSFHKYEPGFYPGTGGLNDIGNHNGKGYSCNIPLHEGYTDATFEYIFERVFPVVCNSFCPDALVVQCGADALAHDPNGGGNLTIKGYSNCIKMILNKQIPTLLLGGGGYNHANTARLWTSITAQLVNIDLDNDIPEHTNWPSYGPDYTLRIAPTYAKDRNSKEYLDKCIAAICENLNKYLNLQKCVNYSNKDSHCYRSTKLYSSKYKLENKQAQDALVDPPTKSPLDVYDFVE